MNENKAFLQIDDLTVEYVTKAETVHAVNNVSLKLEKGKVLERKQKSGGASASSPAFVRLQSTARELEQLISASRGRPNKDLAELANQLRQVMDKWKL